MYSSYIGEQFPNPVLLSMCSALSPVKICSIAIAILRTLPKFFVLSSKRPVFARRIFALVSSELELVEKGFELQARSNVQIITSLNNYLRLSEGERIRPALIISQTTLWAGTLPTT
jgi:hypothetical protein